MPFQSVVTTVKDEYDDGEGGVTDYYFNTKAQYVIGRDSDSDSDGDSIIYSNNTAGDKNGNRRM